ncbi:MAG TPA: hypothetical protein VLI43_07725, partial [Gemmatimonadaceae bacterium]|nr:hypothetical protein [Gemmatimonadaceae bacterium]
NLELGRTRQKGAVHGLDVRGGVLEGIAHRWVEAREGSRAQIARYRDAPQCHSVELSSELQERTVTFGAHSPNDRCSCLANCSVR